ncbi:hypothetical protein BH20ACI4_BH20ACI4_12340 [soil metagenome]
MKFLLLILLLLFLFSCQKENSSEDANKIGGNITANSDFANSVSEKQIVKKLTPKCGRNTFTILIANKYGSEHIIFAEGNTIRRTVKMPDQSDAANFSLDRFGETKNGFEIAVEYGSKYYYRKSFNFVCEKDDFYFDKVGVEKFEKNSPGKITKKDIKMSPKEPIERFSFTGFLID